MNKDSLESAQADVARAVPDMGTLGFVGRWDHQALTTDCVLDEPRHYQYARAGLYWSRAFGALGVRAEAGGTQGSTFLWPSMAPCSSC